jgi:hypothetical protein
MGTGGTIRTIYYHHRLPSELDYISSHGPESRAHIVINTASDISTKDSSVWSIRYWRSPNAS